MPSLKKSKVKSSRRGLPAGLTVAFLALMLLLYSTGVAEASLISIKLTTDALGLGSSNINHGPNESPVDADVPDAFWTSDITGEGSILQIQKSGVAGPGTGADSLFVTVTAGEHLDVRPGLYDFPTPNDYQAGIITLTKDNARTPEGKGDGLGVRAFTVSTVVGSEGLRVLDSSTGRALIEGSKHVSGGDGAREDKTDPNGAPHEDEDVTFDFDPAFNVFADSVEVLLSEFEFTDIIVLSINGAFNERLSPADVTNTGDSIYFSQVGVDNDKLWKLKFVGLAELSDILVDRFTIRADSDTGHKNHFYINGLTAEASPVPIPGAIYLLGSGLIGLAGIRRKFRK